MKIDFLIGDNPYGTTVHFAKGLAQALEASGVQTRLFWVADGQFYQAFYEIMANPPDLTCSFSDISLQGKPLGELWQIPHLSILVDPPIYFLHQLKGEYSWVSCVDRYDCDFVKKIGFQRSFFLPHGVDAHLKTEIKKIRPYEVVFFGTCIDYEALERSWEGEEKEILTAASNRVLSPAGISIIESLIELGVQEGDLARYHHAVDQYTRGKDRVELIRSLNRYQVHVWGEGPWDHYIPSATVHAPIHFNQTLDIMRESQVVLNSSPRFKAGSHERIFYALMCGASVYTGENAFTRDYLPNIYIYRFGEWENRSLGDWEERAQEGQQVVCAGHTYQARADLLLKSFKGYFTSWSK